MKCLLFFLCLIQTPWVKAGDEIIVLDDERTPITDIKVIVTNKEIKEVIETKYNGTLRSLNLLISNLKKERDKLNAKITTSEGLLKEISDEVNKLPPRKI